jgi:hypothetical protein
MNHALAKVAAASGLAAAAATPFTLSAFAGTSPVASVQGPVGAATSQVSATVSQVTQALGLQPVPINVSSATSSAPQTADPASDPSGEAPPASASADAVSIPLLDTCISCTSADAGPGSADGNATALRVLGHDISAGSVSGNGQNQNALIALPANPLLNLAIADWFAAAQSSDSSSNGSARASLVDLSLGSGASQIATLAVLEASSNASWNASSSTGSAFTNGVHLNLGNGALVVILLHSDSDSTNGAHAYIASINGASILSNQTVGKPIVITIPGVITITLLQATSSGGVAVGSVATGSGLLGMVGQQVGLFTTSGSGGGSPSSNSGVQAANFSAPEFSLGVPETGIGMGILGFVLAAGGAAAAVAARLRRRTTDA